ncbi:MAG: hypothetical protein R3D83_06680 [Caenibius sp.]
MAAYRSGIFLMADSREDPDVYWIEPRERAILPLEASLFALARPHVAPGPILR